MRYFFKPVFLRLFKKLDKIKRQQVLEAIEALKTILEAHKTLEGLGLKRLSKSFWEIRSSLKDRILFSYEKDIITFMIVGNHDDIARYLKNR